jgi:hypothetical protein
LHRCYSTFAIDSQSFLKHIFPQLLISMCERRWNVA